MDFSRLRNGEIVAAISGLALFIFMFFNWFGGGIEISTGGTQDVPGIGEIPSEPSIEETGVSGWDSLADFSGFLIALAAVSGVTLGALAVAGRRINLPFQRGVGTLVLGMLAVLLILWRMLANPGDLEIGIFLGLIAAAGIAIGAWVALREDGFEPLLKVPGGRTKVGLRERAGGDPNATPRHGAQRRLQLWRERRDVTLEWERREEDSLEWEHRDEASLEWERREEVPVRGEQDDDQAKYRLPRQIQRVLAVEELGLVSLEVERLSFALQGERDAPQLLRRAQEVATLAGSGHRCRADRLAVATTGPYRVFAQVTRPMPGARRAPRVDGHGGRRVDGYS